MSNKRSAPKKISEYGATRREVFHIGNSLMLPALLGGSQAMAATGPLQPGKDIYRSIGVEPVINCRGTFTIIGASVELPEVRAAMDAAAQQFVQLDELAEAVGRRLAELTGAEWGMVSSGCAAGLKHVTAACVAGGNPEKLLRIPDLTGLDKTEVVAPRSARSAYDHAIRNIGVKMITVETAEELERALSSRTAMIYLSAGGSGPLSLENVAKMAKPHDIPILVDAAAEVLTIPNVHLQRGATVVAYSGGKAICGPQCAGLLLGRKDILLSAWQASSPHHGPGRDNKVGREETLGMLAAVEAWVKRDHEAEWKKWLSYLDTIAKRVSQDGWNQCGCARAKRAFEQESVPCDLVGSGETARHRRRNSRRGGAYQAAHCARRGSLAASDAASESRYHLDQHHCVDDAAGRRQDRGRAAVRGAVAQTQPQASTRGSGCGHQRTLGCRGCVLQQQEPAHAHAPTEW